MKHFLQATLFNVVLESGLRVRRLQVDKVVDALDIKAGDTIADIGAGTGLFSRRFALAAQPGGTVYAVDTNPVLTRKIAKTAEKKKIGNLKGVLATSTDFSLPERVDMMFMCDVLHHVDDKVPFLKNVPKYLKSGGSLAIIDFRDKWPPFHGSMRFSVEECEGWMKQAGLKRVDSHDFLLDTIWSFFHIYEPEPS